MGPVMDSVYEPFDTRVRDLSIRRFGAIGLPSSFLDVLAFRPDIVHCHEFRNISRRADGVAAADRMPAVLTVHDAIPHSEGGSGTNSTEEGLRRRMRAAATHITVHGQSCISDFRKASPDYTGEIVSRMHGVLMVPRTDTAPVHRSRRRAFCSSDGCGPTRGSTFSSTPSTCSPSEAYPTTRSLPVAGLKWCGCGARMAGYADDRDHRRLYLGRPIPAPCSSPRASSPSPTRMRRRAACWHPRFGNRRPVVASATGGIPDVVTDGVTGLLVPPGDADCIGRRAGTRAHIEVACGKPDRRRKGNSAGIAELGSHRRQSVDSYRRRRRLSARGAPVTTRPGAPCLRADGRTAPQATVDHKRLSLTSISS